MIQSALDWESFIVAYRTFCAGSVMNSWSSLHIVTCVLEHFLRTVAPEILPRGSKLLHNCSDMPQPGNLQNGDRPRHASCGSTSLLLHMSGLGHVRRVLQYMKVAQHDVVGSK